MRMAALHSSIRKLSASLKILNLGQESTIILDVRGRRKSLFPQVSNIRVLDLGCCNFQRCPEWIGQINGLYKLTIGVREVADGVNTVAGLPSLVYFDLFTIGVREVADDVNIAYFNLDTGHDGKEESVVIPGGGAFKSLKHLIFSCPKAPLTFEPGAMPKLGKLDLLFPYRMTRQFLPVGIEHLPAPTLQAVTLRASWEDVEVNWENNYWSYSKSDEESRTDRQHRQTVRSLLKRAFKAHHPSTDIAVTFEEYGDEEDDKDVDDAEDYEEEEDNEDYEEDGDEEDDEDVNDAEDYEEEEDGDEEVDEDVVYDEDDYYSEDDYCSEEDDE